MGPLTGTIVCAGCGPARRVSNTLVDGLRLSASSSLSPTSSSRGTTRFVSYPLEGGVSVSSLHKMGRLAECPRRVQCQISLESESDDELFWLGLVWYDDGSARERGKHRRQTNNKPRVSCMNNPQCQYPQIQWSGTTCSVVLFVSLWSCPVFSSDGPSGPGAVVRNSIGMSLTYCPPGTFQMGSSPTDRDRKPEEQPQQAVEITQGFFLGTYEVTQSEWFSMMHTEPWKLQQGVIEDPRAAVTYVSWYDAQEFCRRLSLHEGKAYRLPTEAEWEYACRAGTTTRFSFGDDAAKLSEFGWWGSTEEQGTARDEQYTHRVGLKRPNPWGFFDMHGHVWEWCQDAYSATMPGGQDPFTSGDQKSTRYIRGGGWCHVGIDCRSAYRPADTPESKHIDLGFRVALIPSGKHAGR